MHGVLPAHERLEPGRPAGASVDEPLVEDAQVAVQDGGGNSAWQAQVVGVDGSRPLGDRHAAAGRPRRARPRRPREPAGRRRPARAAVRRPPRSRRPAAAAGPGRDPPPPARRARAGPGAGRVPRPGRCGWGRRCRRARPVARRPACPGPGAPRPRPGGRRPARALGDHLVGGGPPEREPQVAQVVEVHDADRRLPVQALTLLQLRAQVSSSPRRFSSSEVASRRDRRAASRSTERTPRTGSTVVAGRTSTQPNTWSGCPEARSAAGSSTYGRAVAATTWRRDRR